MASFTFLVQSRDGLQRSGALDASSRDEAARTLRGQGLLILRLAEGGAAGDAFAQEARSGSGLIADQLQRYFPVVTRDRIGFFRHLAMMIRAGITLTNALRLQATELPKQRMRAAVAAIHRDVQGGLPFSQAMRNQRLFPSIAASIIGTAEESGELAESLDRIADYLEYWSGLKKKIIQSFAYPSVVVCVAVFVTAILAFNFIPKLEHFLSQSGKALPPITQMVFDASQFARTNWPYLLLGFCAVGAAIAFMLQRPKGRRFLERVLCNVPVLGKVVVASVMAQIAGVMSVMLRSGLGLVNALNLMRTMTRLKIYEDALDQAARQIVAGRTLREALTGPMIPQGAVSVIAAGEESGTLVESFQELERFHTRELEGLVSLLVALVEPMLIIFVGGIVAIVYFAMFAALIRLV